MTDAVASARVAAARARVALEPRVAVERLEVAGADRVRFLHNLCTADVKALAPGTSARAFVTTVQGKIVSSAEILALDERLELELPPGRSAAVEAHLSRYRIVERVELAMRPGVASARLRGPSAAEALLAAGLPAPAEPGAHRAEGTGEALLRVRRLALGREPRFELSGPAPALDAALARLRGASGAEDLAELGEREAEILRIEDGEPRFGVDYGEEAFPQETGDAAAVSYAKGCYLGQEVVARIHYRGGVQRTPQGLRFADDLPAAGTPVLADGREAGSATSVARSPRFGAIGLGLLHRRAAEPSARLELAGGGRVELVPLPFD